MITLDATSVGTGTRVISLTVSHTVSAGNDRILMIGVGFNNNPSSAVVASVTYGGVPATFVAQVAQGNDTRSEIWRLLAPAVGTANIVVTLSELPLSNTGFVVGGASFFGVDQAAPLGSVGTAAATTGLASVTIASAAGELVFDTASAEDTGGPLTPGAGQSVLWNAEGGSGSRRTQCGGSTKAGALSVTMEWTLDVSEDWAIVAVALLPAPPIVSGGSPPTSILGMIGA